jgi:adenine-specific DNA-methyltransferase
MKLLSHSPAKALSKAYLRQSLRRDQIDLFKCGLARMFERIRTDEHEEHLKNIVSDFLKDTWYKQTNEINTSGRTDLVIHNGKNSSDTVGVLIEVKRPGNNNEMISFEKPNTKALHELLHYYMQERYVKGNMEVRRLIVCNIHEWYIFDASDFERIFFHNRKFVENYQKWSEGLFSGDKTDWLYREILKPFVENELETLPCTYFNLKEYARGIRLSLFARVC